MNDLSLDRKPWIYIRFGIGILSLIAAVSFLFSREGGLHLFEYSMITAFTLAALFHMTDDFGLNKSFLDHDRTRLIVKWVNKYRPAVIDFPEIETICLRRKEIIINRKTDKSLKLSLTTFRRDQKNEIYNFFIRLSDENKLTLTRQFN